ncbi:MAG: acyl--CoA ligase [Alphaproteobacteria bacterium]|nr:acyl--CoA ligase [Alphaproteobacteria bacterium]
MSKNRLRDEVHYGERVVRAYAERPASIDAMFRASVAAHGGRIALVEGARAITYGELDGIVDRVAAGLAGEGLRQGERIALLLGNRVEFVFTILAAARLGAIVVPINIRHRLGENEFVLAQCEASMLVHEADQAENVPPPAALPALRRRFACGGDVPGALPFGRLLAAAAPPPAARVAEDDCFCILYTSGTTGRPKGAMLTHFGCIHSCLHFQYGMEMREGDSTILAVPASHVTGLVAIILTMLRIGGSVVMMQAFRARAYLELAQAARITHSLMVPAMYNLCLLDPEFERFDLSSWRVGGYGGAPMPEATIAALAEKLPGLTLVNAYGATETTSPATMMPLGEGLAHADSVGRTVPCGEIRIMDAEGRELPPGEPGEIWIAGPMVVPGYWDNPEANRANFLAGYWKSGDIGSKDAQGYVRVFDRLKDMINRGGYKIFSAELENELAHHPGILECAIVGRPDPVLGEKVQAFILRKDPALTAEAVRAFCAARVSDYKVPDHVTFIDEPLPRNPNGKVIKNALRRRLVEGA